MQLFALIVFGVNPLFLESLHNILVKSGDKADKAMKNHDHFFCWLKTKSNNQLCVSLFCLIFQTEKAIKSFKKRMNDEN